MDVGGVNDAPATESAGEVGISPRAGWIVSMVLYGVTGAGFALLMAFGVYRTTPGVVAVNAAAVAFAGFCAVGLKLWPEARWGFHVRISVGIGLLFAGGLMVPEAIGATHLVLMFAALPATLMYSPRVSIPYLLAGTSLNAALMLRTDDPTAHGIMTSVAFLGIGTALVASRQELLRIAKINTQLSVVDPLTGVANVRRLRLRLNEAIAIGELTGRRPALVAMDLDDFKQVNDRFSHTLGDDVLCAVAREVQQAIGEQDLLARRGGDEFVVLVDDAHARDLEALRERVSEAIRRARNATCPEVNPRGSVAYAVQRAGEPADALIARSDDELHAAKLNAHPERRRHDSPGRREEALDARTSHMAGGRGDELATDLSMARSINRALGNASTWQVICVISVFTGLGVGLTLLTATGSELLAPVPLAGIGVLGLILALAVHGARNGTSDAVLHVMLVAALATEAAVMFSVDHLRIALADVILLTLVSAFHAFPPRVAARYMVLCLVLFDAVVLSADHPNALLRVIVTGGVAIVSAAMLAKARQLAREYTLSAVELSTVDPLTGTLNLRGLRRAVADAVDRCRQTGQRLALIAVDLDDFKLVNDRHSHTLGDRVLIDVAEAMRRSIREVDTVTRRGGDEFTIVCTIDDELELLPLMTRLQEQIAAVRSALVPDVAPTATVGSVTLEEGESADAFLGRADSELHGAKEVSHRRRGMLEVA